MELQVLLISKTDHKRNVTMLAATSTSSLRALATVVRAMPGVYCYLTSGNGPCLAQSYSILRTQNVDAFCKGKRDNSQINLHQSVKTTRSSGKN
jgi:hypothetical protein